MCAVHVSRRVSRMASALSRAAARAHLFAVGRGCAHVGCRRAAERRLGRGRSCAGAAADGSAVEGVDGVVDRVCRAHRSVAYGSGQVQAIASVRSALAAVGRRLPRLHYHRSERAEGRRCGRHPPHAPRVGRVARAGQRQGAGRSAVARAASRPVPRRGRRGAVRGCLRRFTDPNQTHLPLLSTLTVFLAPPLRLLFRRWREWAPSQAFARHADRFREWQRLRLSFRAWHAFVRQSADSVRHPVPRAGSPAPAPVSAALLVPLPPLCTPLISAHSSCAAPCGLRLCSWRRACGCWTLRAVTLN